VYESMYVDMFYILWPAGQIGSMEFKIKYLSIQRLLGTLPSGKEAGVKVTTHTLLMLRSSICVSIRALPHITSECSALVACEGDHSAYVYLYVHSPIYLQSVVH
jgi:hypothetical protein